MVSLEWRDEYRTGIAGVDYEHEMLIAQINELLRLIDAGTERERVLDGIGDVYGAISAHFALEEQMMRRHGYAEYATHKADHERLLDEIQEIADTWQRDIALDVDAFKRTLADWFGEHFRTHDARLHRLAEMREHETVHESTLSRMIRNAKNRLLQRALAAG